MCAPSKTGLEILVTGRQAFSVIAMIPEGWQWNQAELDRGDPLNTGLLSILVIGNDLRPELIGTAFLVTANGNHATAISAAHCFEQVRKVLHPNLPHHTSALSEFLPPPEEIDLQRVRALYIKEGAAHFCPTEIGIWDNATDLAVFTVNAPANDFDLFRDLFWIDNEVPTAGEEVIMIGFGKMKVLPDAADASGGTIQRQLLARLGRVEEIFPERHIMLKGPCIQTSIAIFGGMSGGPVAKWTGPNTGIKPFAFISHAPDPQPLYDRSISGHSVASILSARIETAGDKRQVLTFAVSNIAVGKDGAKSQPRSSLEFLPDEHDD